MTTPGLFRVSAETVIIDRCVKALDMGELLALGVDVDSHNVAGLLKVD